MVKHPLELLWKDDGTISVSKRIQKPNGADNHAWVTHWEGKCKISFFNSMSSNHPANNNGLASAPPLTVKLFLPKDVIVPPGCRVDVTHEERVYRLKNSGDPAVFSHHQEVLMEVAQEWA